MKINLSKNFQKIGTNGNLSDRKIVVKRHKTKRSMNELYGNIQQENDYDNQRDDKNQGINHIEGKNLNGIKSQRKSKKCLSPTFRYFKNVMNIDYENIQAQNQQLKFYEQLSDRSKSQLKSPDQQLLLSTKLNPNQRQSLQRQSMNQSSNMNNFSLNLLNQPSSLKQFQRPTEPKKPLNFNKVYIVEKDQSPFRQVIQLSVRELENKEMLEKAVGQLEKRKLKKKKKMLKNGGFLTQRDSKQAVLKGEINVKQLIKQKIGYNTFYKKQIKKSDIKLPQVNQTQFEASVIDQIQLERKQISPQFQNSNALKDDPNPQNIFVQTQTPVFKTRPRHKTNIDLTLKAIDQEQDSKISVNRKQRLKTLSFRLPSLNQFPTKDSEHSKSHRNCEYHHKQPMEEFIPKNNQPDTQRSLAKSLASLKHHILKTPPQTVDKQLNRSTVSLDQQNSNTKQAQSQILKHKTEFQFESSQVNQSPNQKSQQQNNQLIFLTKEDIEEMLNKSRYQIKKLMCMHIQKRKKQWKKLKIKSLMQDQHYDQQKTLNQKITQDNQSTKDTKGLNKAEKVNLDLLERSQFSKTRTLSQKIILPPQHMLKLHTKDLKKSIKQYVNSMKKIKKS